MSESDSDQTPPAGPPPRRIIPPQWGTPPTPPPAVSADTAAPQSVAATVTATAAPRESWLDKIAWPVFLAIAFVYALSAWLPWHTSFPAGDLDSSWLMALKWAHTHGLDFGHDFVFTFGPWGFAMNGYDPANFGAMIGVWTLFTVAFFAGLVVLAKHLTTDRWLAGGWMLLVLAISGGPMGQINDVRMFSLSWLLLALHFYVEKRSISLVTALLAVAMALSGEIKFSINLMALIALAIIAVDDLYKRRVPWLLAVYGASYLVFWLWAGQRLGSLLPYIHHSLEISAAYADGEGISQPTETTDVLLFLACALPLMAAVVISRWRQWVSMSLALAAVTGCIFLAFKAGYVRHDEHEWEGTVGLAVIALLWVSAMLPSARIVGKALGVLCVVGSLALCWYSYLRWPPGNGLASEMMQTVTDFPARATTAWTWIAGHCDQQPQYETYLKATAAARTMPPIHSTVDVYPWAQGVVIAAGLDYRPRPVIQSYLTYTSALAELNAEFLRGDKAPQTILFDFGTINGRYFSEDEALSWPELLTRYDVKDAASSFLTLQRAAQPRQYTMTPLETGTSSFNSEITLPSDGHMIWAKFQIKKTALCKIEEALYKPPWVVLKFTLESGGGGEAHLEPSVVDQGFLLSPIVQDWHTFAALQSSNWQSQLAGSRVKSISIFAQTDSGHSACYDDVFQYSFSALDFPRTDLSAVPGMAEYTEFQQFIKQVRVVNTTARPQVIGFAGYRQALVVPVKTQLLYPLQPSRTSLHVGLGMLDQSFNGDNKTDGETFRVYAVRPSGEGRMIFSRKLDPAGVPADRGEQTADFAIPPGAAELILEVEPVTAGKANFAYWSQFQLH